MCSWEVDRGKPCGDCCCGCGGCECVAPWPRLLREYEGLFATAVDDEALDDDEDDDDDEEDVGGGRVTRVVLVSECQNLTTTRPLRLQQSRPTAWLSATVEINVSVGLFAVAAAAEDEKEDGTAGVAEVASGTGTTCASNRRNEGSNKVRALYADRRQVKQADRQERNAR